MQNEDNGGTREAVSTAVTDPEGQPFSVPTLVVGIGASAGGLQALERCFRQMPADTGLAFVVVVHLAPASESHLATLLQKCTAMPVVPMQRARELAPDQIYVIPPNCNLAMSDGMLRLLPLGAEHTRGGIDHFFRTLANAQGANAIGIVLSGTGSDGALGLSRIKEAGGMTIVQAPAEAEYDSMPQSAMSTGAVDLVLTVDEIVAKLVALGRRYSRGANTHTIAAPAVEEHDVLQQILALVRGQSGHDFTRYKPSSMMRRIGRRMQLHGIEQLTAYYAFLREERNEVQALFSDFLVTTTNFFRDAAAFAALSQQVIPALFEGKGSNDQVRVWTVGCATGEEAYSLAILLLEYAEQLENPPALQIFATDLSEEALRRARAGFYLDTIAMDLAPERLARFFVKESDGYRVGKELREIVLFATHSLLRDPPFSKIDLISCRNVLIYLQRSAQRQLLELFHYALVSDGYLFLGSAETTDTTALFQDVNRRCNIFQANRTESATVQWLAAPLVRPLAHPPVSFSQVNREGLSDAEIFHLQLLEECAPPRVIVNADYEIIYFSEGVSRYLYQPRGEPTNRVLRRICEELRVELTTALFRAFEHGEASQTQAVSLQFDGRKCWVVLDVRPALTPYRKGYAVLFFHEYADEAGVRNKSPQEEQTMRVLEEE
ncbi:MAG: hypothetical protein KDE19_22780, partial [Caldilineaceae bacterium]|nr:hypothetical protein [Caldilineaceae bacterium]